MRRCPERLRGLLEDASNSIEMALRDGYRVSWLPEDVRAKFNLVVKPGDEEGLPEHVPPKLGGGSSLASAATTASAADRDDASMASGVHSTRSQDDLPLGFSAVTEVPGYNAKARAVSWQIPAMKAPPALQLAALTQGRLRPEEAHRPHHPSAAHGDLAPEANHGTIPVPLQQQGALDTPDAVRLEALKSIDAPEDNNTA